MSVSILIPQPVHAALQVHLFQNALEQGAFLLARVAEGADRLCLEAVDAYFVPPEGWEVQTEAYLELKDSERARVMYWARQARLALIDCHSHPDSASHVWFSPSDRTGITDFAAYARWKLEGKPYVGTVWGEASVDAVVWHGDFAAARPVDQVAVVEPDGHVLRPRGTWFRRRAPTWRSPRYGR
jgi:hypothetical protein